MKKKRERAVVPVVAPVHPRPTTEEFVERENVHEIWSEYVCDDSDVTISLGSIDLPEGVSLTDCFITSRRSDYDYYDSGTMKVALVHRSREVIKISHFKKQLAAHEKALAKYEREKVTYLAAKELERAREDEKKRESLEKELRAARALLKKHGRS